MRLVKNDPNDFRMSQKISHIQTKRTTDDEEEYPISSHSLVSYDKFDRKDMYIHFQN